MMIMLLLFSLFSYAETTSTESYCFGSIKERELAEKKVQGIQVPSDKVSPENRCLTITMSSHRRELLQRYLLANFPELSVTFSSEEMAQKPCLLKIEKIKQDKAEETTATFSKYPKIENTQVRFGGQETMQIQTLKEFALTVDQDEIMGECRFITSERYEIKLIVRRVPKPLVPSLQQQAPPKDEQTMMLQTQLQLSRGERINIGEVVKQLKQGEHNVNFPKSVDYASQQNHFSQKVFLSLQ